MAGFERMTINMTGGGPWGFRLFGGEEEPLIIAKLRKRSKAAEAGLEEGDVLISINGYSCKNTSHPVAMGLVDQAGSNLSFDIIRGTPDQSVIDGAFQQSAGQLKPMPSSVRPQNAAPAFTPSQAITNGYEPKTSSSRQHQVYSDGNTTTEVTMETSTEQFGGTTLTKTRRETKSSSQWGSGVPEAPKPMFSVTDNTGVKPKPGTWQPNNPGGAPPRKISAPSGITLQQNPDQSVTMTIGNDFTGSKENIAPHSEAQPLFKVAKVSQQNKPGVWQPAHAPAPVSRPPPAPVAEPEYQPEYTQPAQRAAPVHVEHMDIGDDSNQFHLGRILHENNPGRDSPNIRRKIAENVHDYARAKKIFADSAFYDDPEHKYPTIEEQIKMARKVALQLLAPANSRARGHTMFLKRQERADKWTTEFPGQHKNQKDEQEKKYFHPDPLHPKHTWQPPKPVAHLHNTQITHWEDPDIRTVPSAYKAPKLPLGLLNDIEKHEKTKALSAEEFERMRLYEQKVQHNQVSPQLSFSLAEDLKSMRGKGGKLFAKRKARVDKFTQGSDDSPSQPRPMNPDFLNKLTGGMMPPKVIPSEPAITGPKAPAGPPVNRLKEMIDPPKAPMTPWDAVAEHGDVDKAFTHLDGYLAQKNAGSFKHQIAKNLETKAKGPPPPPINIAPAGPPVMPEFTRKIKPWDGDSTDLKILPQVTNPSQKPRFGGSKSTTAPSTKPQRPWSTIENSSGFILDSPTSSLPTSNTSTPASGAKPFKPFNSDSPTGGSIGATQPAVELPKPSGFRSVKFSMPNETAGVFDAGSGGTAPWRKNASRFSAAPSSSPQMLSSPASSSVDNFASPAGSLSRASPHESYSSEQRAISEEDGFCDL